LLIKLIDSKQIILVSICAFAFNISIYQLLVDIFDKQNKLRLCSPEEAADGLLLVLKYNIFLRIFLFFKFDSHYLEELLKWHFQIFMSVLAQFIYLTITKQWLERTTLITYLYSWINFVLISADHARAIPIAAFYAAWFDFRLDVTSAFIELLCIYLFRQNLVVFLFVVLVWKVRSGIWWFFTFYFSDIKGFDENFFLFLAYLVSHDYSCDRWATDQILTRSFLSSHISFTLTVDLCFQYSEVLWPEKWELFQFR